MFLLHRPTEPEIEAFLATQQNAPLSYQPVGLTRNPPSSGYNIDHNRIQLGAGAAVFNAAVVALRAWQMFDLD
jgi:uncharacterized protein (UPF0548 family)